MYRVLISLVLSLAFAQTTSASQIFGECGQEISGKAVMVGDLDCTGSAPAAELFGATLDMQGHTLTGGGLSCYPRCKVTSSVPGGRIVNAGAGAFGSTPTNAKLIVENLEFDGGTVPVFSDGTVKATNIVVRNASGFALHGSEKVLVRGSFFENNAGGLVTYSRISVDDSTVLNTASGAAVAGDGAA